MNTETGRIFSPEQMEAANAALSKKTDEERAKLYESLVDQASVLEVVRGLREGKVVPVSEEVVQKVKLGERELARRQRRRARRS